MVSDTDTLSGIHATNTCQLRDLLDRLADKWSLLVVELLGREGTLRFSELRREIDGISQRMLTLTLRHLGRMRPLRATPQVPGFGSSSTSGISRSVFDW